MDEIGDAVSVGFRTVTTHVRHAAEAIPEEQYGYRPTNAVRSFGALIAHIVDGHRYYAGLARGTATEWTDAVEQEGLRKPQLLETLAASVEDCINALDAPSARLGPMIDSLAHTSLHYGNLVTYMRVMKRLPPSSAED